MIKVSIIIPVYNQERLVLKALDSIPKRKDIEVIVTDDKSTDHTWSNLVGWQQIHSNDFGNLVLERNQQNMGCGYSKNWMYTRAQGEYIITLDSDDYLYTDKYNEILDKIYNLNADMIFVGNKINDGSIWTSNDRKATWSYFVKNKFLKDNNLNYKKSARRAGDFELTKALQQLPHEEIILKDIVYHYNYPRKGSIVWNYENGVDENNNRNN